MEQSSAGPSDVSPVGAPMTSEMTSEVMPSGVWPPPPTSGPPVMATILPVFSPVQRLSRAIRVLLSAYAVSAVLGIAGALLPPLPVGRQIEEGAVAMVQGLLLPGIGLCFLVWTYRLSKNLRALGVTGVRNAPAWAVAYFFIPILNLYRPYQVFREIWQASDPDPAARVGRAWRDGSSPALLGFWWASDVLANTMAYLSSNSGGDTSIEMVDNVVALLSTLLAFQVVRLVTARQEKAAQTLSLIP